VSGYLWTSGEVAVGRYTEAQLLDGRTVPVCIVLGKRGYMEKWDDSKPGAAELNRSFRCDLTPSAG
jgi:serine/threonine-protein kinase